MLKVVPDSSDRGQMGEAGSSLIDAIVRESVREGARRMPAEALHAGVDADLARFADGRDERGRLPGVRTGDHQPREGLPSAGAVGVQAPRVNDTRADSEMGERERFSSAILPPWCRTTPTATDVRPLLSLHGLSSGDFVSASGQFLGSTAGRSAPVITKLTEQREKWKAEQRAFAQRDLSEADDGYLWAWADGIRVHSRLGEHKLPGVQALPARHERRAGGRPRGAHRAYRRLPRVDRAVGRPAA